MTKEIAYFTNGAGHEQWAGKLIEQGRLRAERSHGDVRLRAVNADGRSHHESGPAEMAFIGKTRSLAYRRHGELHREDGPARIIDHGNGHVSAEWLKNGRYVEDGRPNSVEFRDGKVASAAHYAGRPDGRKLHRVGGPALVVFGENGRPTHIEYRTQGYMSARLKMDERGTLFAREGDHYVDAGLARAHAVQVREAAADRGLELAGRGRGRSDGVAGGKGLFSEADRKAARQLTEKLAQGRLAGFDGLDLAGAGLERKRAQVGREGR